MRKPSQLFFLKVIMDWFFAVSAVCDFSLVAQRNQSPVLPVI